MTDRAADSGRCTERELTETVDLCRPDGRLHPDAVGWSRQPLHRCGLPGSWGRRKRWDYWCVTAPGVVLSVTLADADYVGIADVWFLELATRRVVTRSALVPFARGLSMPDVVGGGSMRVERGGFRVSIEEEDGGTRLSAEFDLAGGAAFACDVRVERPPRHESLTVVIPWSDSRFQCTNKDNTRPARGFIRIGGSEFRLAEDAWGCLDFGRGKWPYRMRWNWGAASGRAGGRTVGLQFGGKWTVGTGLTENALCVDGRLSKLSEELVWEYDERDWLRPWRIRTPRSRRVDVTFVPEYDKVSGLQAGVAESRVHQCFGRWHGRVEPDEGGAFDFEGLFGWAEEARWRW